MRKYDVSHKTGSTQRIVTSPGDGRATAIGGMHNNVIKTGRVVPETKSPAITHKHTDMLIIILCSPTGGGE